MDQLRRGEEVHELARRKPEEQRLVAMLAEAETLFVEVKNEYELYFLQRVRRAPLVKTATLRRKIRELDRHFTSNTQLKFRRGSLKSRFGSLSNYWRRTMEQIEAGTYHRHKVMARRRESEREFSEMIKKRAAERAADATAAAAPAADDDSRVFKGESRKLARHYIEQRKRAGESVSNMDEKKILMRLQQHARALKARTGCDEVKFKVKIKDGKTKLIATPVKRQGS